jgi:poly(A)-specific ribonuclease
MLFMFFQFENLNSWIISGISYLSRGQENEALRRLSMAYEDELSDTWCKLKEVRDIPLNRMADVLFTERIKNRFSEWRNGLLRDRNGGFQLQWNSNDSKQQFQTVFFKMRPALSLTGFTSHQFRLIHLVMFYPLI